MIGSCVKCAGAGKVYVWREGPQPCPACDGTGKTKDERLRDAAPRLAEALDEVIEALQKLLAFPNHPGLSAQVRAKVRAARAVLREAGVES